MKKYFYLILLVVLGAINKPLLAQTQPNQIPDAIPRFDTLSDWELSELATDYFKQAKNILDTFEVQAADATKRRLALEADLGTLKNDSTTTRGQLDSVNVHLKAAKSGEKTLLKQRKQAEKTALFIDKVVHMEAGARRKNMSKCLDDLQKIDKLLHPPSEPAAKPIAEIVGSQEVAFPSDTMPVTAADTLAQASEAKDKPNKLKTKTLEKPGAKYSSYDPSQDVLFNPPNPPCSLALNVRDEFSGEIRKETARTELFRFTNPLLRNYYKDKPHILCEAGIGTAGPSATLNLVYTIRDANARKAFGTVQKNGVAILKFIDGTTFTLYNIRPDEGTFDPNGQVATYRAQYGLDKTILKKMRTNMIDKIRMAWSTGYEDYDVQQIDVLMRQVHCIE